MVPASDESPFTANVESEPMHFNSLPKLICLMRQYVLIPIELQHGSAEDANLVKGDNAETLSWEASDLLRLCIFASEWRQCKNWEIVCLRFVLTGFGSPRPLCFLSLFQAIWNAHKIVGRKHGDHDPLGDRFLEMCELVFSSRCWFSKFFKFFWQKTLCHFSILRVLFCKTTRFGNPMCYESIDFPLSENRSMLSKDSFLKTESHFIYLLITLAQWPRA